MKRAWELQEPGTEETKKGMEKEETSLREKETSELWGAEKERRRRNVGRE